MKCNAFHSSGRRLCPLNTEKLSRVLMGILWKVYPRRNCKLNNQNHFLKTKQVRLVRCFECEDLNNEGSEGPPRKPRLWALARALWVDKSTANEQGVGQFFLINRYLAFGKTNRLLESTGYYNGAEQLAARLSYCRAAYNGCLGWTANTERSSSENVFLQAGLPNYYNSQRL